jgi:hypothetical protein
MPSSHQSGPTIAEERAALEERLARLKRQRKVEGKLALVNVGLICVTCGCRSVVPPVVGFALCAFGYTKALRHIWNYCRACKACGEIEHRVEGFDDYMTRETASTSSG